MSKQKEKYPIGTRVYYSLDNWDDNGMSIYSGVIEDIKIQDLKVGDKSFKVKFYYLDNGMGLQRNAFYTIDELFQLKERLEQNMQSVEKEILLGKSTN